VITRAVKWIAGRILRLIPEGVRGRLLPGEFGFAPAEMPPPPIAPDGRVRLFIAPVNYAGQGWHWARAVDSHVAGAGAVNMVVRMRSDFGHPADNVVPLGFYAASTRWQRMQRNAVADGFTHVMIEAEKQPFGAILDESVASQARWLQKRGLRVVMLCHGSDIRLPSRHIALNHDSPFLDSLAAVSGVLERTARRNRELLDDLACPVFVSTPDLLLDVPSARWLPVVVDSGTWRTDTIPLSRQRPVVAHAPSSGSVKGSELIDPILRRLDDDGVISYLKVERVPFARMPSIYREADIVLDQVRLGDYGVASCEAMAAGRVVIGHVSEHARAHVLEATGRSLPIVESTAGDLEAVIRGILADPARFRAVARDGADFVSQVHDGRMSARVLESVLS
jgi:hypothetical protein